MSIEDKETIITFYKDLIHKLETLILMCKLKTLIKNKPFTTKASINDILNFCEKEILQYEIQIDREKKITVDRAR